MKGLQFTILWQKEDTDLNIWLLKPCYFPGHYIRDICIYGVRDLPWIITRNSMFANKFESNSFPEALDCLEQWHRNKVLSQATVPIEPSMLLATPSNSNSTYFNISGAGAWNPCWCPQWKSTCSWDYLHSFSAVSVKMRGSKTENGRMMHCALCMASVQTCVCLGDGGSEWLLFLIIRRLKYLYGKLMLLNQNYNISN